MGFQDPVHRAMRPLLLVLLLLLWASLPRRRLQPPVLPDVAQQLAQTGFDPDHRPGLLEVLDRFLRTDRYAPSDEWYHRAGLRPKTRRCVGPTRAVSDLGWRTARQGQVGGKDTTLLICKSLRDTQNREPTRGRTIPLPGLADRR